MARGWVCLAAVVDWASRRVLAHRVSITMDTSCLAALEEALTKYGKPEIFNTTRAVNSRARKRAGIEGAQHRHQHGWPRLLARQRLRRAAVEDDQVRACLSARLRLGQRRAHAARAIHRVLQPSPPPFVVGPQDPRRVLLRVAAGASGFRLSDARFVFKRPGPALSSPACAKSKHWPAKKRILTTPYTRYSPASQPTWPRSSLSNQPTPSASVGAATSIAPLTI